MPGSPIARAYAIALAFACLCAGAVAHAEPVALTGEHDEDVRLFKGSGEEIRGLRALEAMDDPDVLVVWFAGNQFFAMERVVRTFQSMHGPADVGVLTLPPLFLLDAIRGGGIAYRGRTFRRLPDVYGSVSTSHLERCGCIRTYATYAHNRLELIVAPGNPKRIARLEDLLDGDLKVSLPNPLTEGIMQVYAKPILERLGLWQGLSSGVDCIDCNPVRHVYFTRVHHREIPERIRDGVADVGLVWRTEGLVASADGHVAEVGLPDDQSAFGDARYVAGVLESTARPIRARSFLDFLISGEGQSAYAAYGFAPATESERRVMSLPSH